MRKLVILFFILALFCGCESRLDNAIPQSSFVGAISNVDVNLRGQGEIATQQACVNKSGWCWAPEDWTLLNADAFVPFDIKREQIKPTSLAILKKLVEKYPKCTTININLAPDKEMAEILYFVGRLEYRDNKIIIHYGIPSDKEMEEHNAEIGKFYSTKNAMFSMPGDKEKIEKNDDPRLFRPDLKTYTLYKRILIIEDDIKMHKQIKESYKFSSPKEYYIALSNKISKQINLPTKDIEYALRFMHDYYGWMGYGKSEESINVPL